MNRFHYWRHKASIKKSTPQQHASTSLDGFSLVSTVLDACQPPLYLLGIWDVPGRQRGSEQCRGRRQGPPLGGGAGKASSEPSSHRLCWSTCYFTPAAFRERLSCPSPVYSRGHLVPQQLDGQMSGRRVTAIVQVLRSSTLAASWWTLPDLRLLAGTG